MLSTRPARFSSSFIVFVGAASLAAFGALGCSHDSPESRTAGIASPQPSSANPASTEQLMNEGRRWTEAFYSGKTQEMWDRMGPALRQLFQDKSGLDDFRDKARSQLGTESSVVSERIETRDGAPWYVRTARFDRAPMPIRIDLALDGDGRIVGFGIKPAGDATSEAPTDKLDYATRTRLRLPFDGAWTIAWGGRTVALNQHAATRDQRFAYDFVVTREGSTHAGDGTKNADYYAWGRPIFAPAAGVVVAAMDGIAENVPGHLDAKHPGGNYLVIDHGGGEYSFLAHMVPGSLAVHEGDHVEAGALVGRCGNSGHSSEPHLHYHLQDSPRFFAGDGLPAPFVDYLADGRPVSRGEPTRGQVVQPSSAGATGQGS